VNDIIQPWNRKGLVDRECLVRVTAEADLVLDRQLVRRDASYVTESDL
jgi:hypothetical protein